MLIDGGNAKKAFVRQPGQSLPVGHGQVPTSKLQVSEDWSVARETWC